MANIDAIGTYRGTIGEATLKLSRNGFPQYVVKLCAAERFIESKNDLDYYVEKGVIEEATPQWINWENFDESIVNYMTLYGNKDGSGEFNEANATPSIQQLQNALGWDGSSFVPFQDDTYVGAKVLFRVAENNNPEFTNLRVAWLDKFDASPTRSLAGIPASEVSALDAKLARGMGFKKKAKVAAPKAAAPKLSVPPKPMPISSAKPKNTLMTSNTSTGGCSAEEGWDYVEANSSETPENNRDAWLSSVAEIEQTRGVDESQFTPQDWAKVRDITLRDLGISPANV